MPSAASVQYSARSWCRGCLLANDVRLRTRTAHTDAPAKITCTDMMRMLKWEAGRVVQYELPGRPLARQIAIHNLLNL